MKNIDWRELYAANRAVIDSARAGGPRRRERAGTGSAPPAAGSDILVPAHAPGVRSRRRRPAQPGGPGSWERLSYRGPGGSRPYFVYTPPALESATRAPLVVMLHGCTQTAADLARSTRMNDVADRHAFLVAYPQQSGRHNSQGCWNWFLPAHQARGEGEAAVIAGIAREAMGAGSGRRVDPDRIFVAGMSAGGAMASVVGSTYPDLFAGLAVHSGLPYAAATSAETAFEAMARGGRDRDGRGMLAFRAMGDRARSMPTIVIHGSADAIVAPVNGDQVVEQWLAANGLSANGSFRGELSTPTDVFRGQVEDGYAYSRYRWNDRHGHPLQEYVKVVGLGHAWSGGAHGVAWSDPRGPDASGAIWDFFAAVG